MNAKYRFRIPRLLQAVLTEVFFYASFLILFDVG